MRLEGESRDSLIAGDRDIRELRIVKINGTTIGTNLWQPNFPVL
jgi:hypothetical protein